MSIFGLAKAMYNHGEVNTTAKIRHPCLQVENCCESASGLSLAVLSKDYRQTQMWNEAYYGGSFVDNTASMLCDSEFRRSATADVTGRWRD
jgi:hypothetical protein